MNIVEGKLLGKKLEIVSKSGLYLTETYTDHEALVPVQVIMTNNVGLKDKIVYVNHYSLKTVKLKGDEFTLLNDTDVIMIENGTDK